MATDPHDAERRATFNARIDMERRLNNDGQNSSGQNDSTCFGGDADRDLLRL